MTLIVGQDGGLAERIECVFGVFMKRSGYLSRRLDVPASGLRDAARQESVVQGLALEMQRSLDYYESQMGQVPPAHIHLVAKDSVLPLASMLSSYLAAGVSNLDWAALGLESAIDSRCLPAWSAGLPLVGKAGK